MLLFLPLLSIIYFIMAASVDEPQPCTYTLVTGAREHSVLILDVNFLQGFVRQEWVNNGVVVGEIVSGQSEVFLKGSIIPSFQSYDTLWKSSGSPNPFKVNWLDYDRYDPCFSGYLAFAIDTLDRQLVLWGVDEPTLKHPVYLHVTEFTSALRRLHAYLVYKGYYPGRLAGQRWSEI